MDLMDRLRAWYEEYAALFADETGGLPYMSQVKLEHSRRVAADCRVIAEEMGWPWRELAGVEAMGLLHDVSRYEQVRDYATFVDARSFDHGERAWEICGQADVFADWPRDIADAALHGIRFHNRRKLQPGQAEIATRFLRLARDADKLDILQVVNEALRLRSYEQHPEILLSITIDGPVNADIIKEIKEQGTASYEHVHSLGDMNLLRTTWVYDVNYAPALRRLRDRRLLEDIAGMLPADPDARAIAREALRYVDRQLSDDTVMTA